MATKQQTASPATQYQDFQPKSEWKEEEEANLLLVYLPGFLREQIGITYVHSSRTIRVVGERPIGNNKWSRFNQAFPVPQNCVVEKIHGRFKNGILSITMPKQTTTKMVPKSEPEMAQKAQIPPKSPEEPKPDKGRPETPTIVEQKQRDEKSTVSSPMAQKGPQDTSPKPTPSSSQKQPDEKLVVPSGTADGTMPAMKQADENKERSIINEKPAGPERAEAVKETHEVKHKKKKIDLKMPGKDLEKRHKDEGEDGGEKHREDPVAAKAKEMTGVAAAAAAAVKRVKGLATATEERQAMVNMGVAVVVIVALGAYISHSFGSSGAGFSLKAFPNIRKPKQPKRNSLLNTTTNLTLNAI